MKFSGKNILLISPESWDHIFVSKHHYAIELSRCNNVFFLNPPGKGGLRVRSTGYENIFSVDYNGFLKGLRFLPAFFQRQAFRWVYRRIERAVKCKFDCVWSFDNSVFFDWRFLPGNVLKICHIVDSSQNFQFRSAASSADICFGVSENIVARLKRFNPKSYLVQHGLAVPAKVEDCVLPGSNQLKAVYAGNLKSVYLDHGTVQELVERFPFVDFIFIGPGGEEWIRRSNVYVIPRVNKEVMFGYLEKGDVLLLLYNYKAFPEQLTNAHKILEYLYTGKVIVASYFSDYSESNLIELTSSREELIKTFSRVLDNLEDLNSKASMDARRNYALKNTYHMRVQEVESLITQFVKTRL